MRAKARLPEARATRAWKRRSMATSAGRSQVLAAASPSAKTSYIALASALEAFLAANWAQCGSISTRAS